MRLIGAIQSVLLAVIWLFVSTLVCKSDSKELPSVSAATIARTFRAANPDIVATQLASAPVGDNGALGRGFSSLGLDWRGDCVDFDQSSTNPPTQNFATNFQLELIDSADKFMQFTGMSASASMSYGVFSGEASASYFRNVLNTAYSVYIAGSVTVITEPMNLKIRGLSTQAARALSVGSKTFYTMCGDQFASAAVYGGEFIFMLEISSATNEEYENIKADVKASMGNFGSGSASFSQSMERLSQRYHLNARIIRNGLNEPIPALTPQIIEQYARDFPAKLAGSNGAGLRILRFGLRNFTSLDPKAPNLTSQQIRLDEIAQQYVSSVEATKVLQYLSDHADEFAVAPDKTKLDSSTRNAAERTDKLYAAALLCGSDPFKYCMMPPGLAPLDMRWIPRRVRWTNLLVKTGAWQNIGTVPVGETRHVRIRGKWSAWSSGENWFPPEQCCLRIQFVSPNGSVRTFGYPTDQVANGGDIVDVRLEDSTYDDNRSNPSSPLQAALY